MKKNPVTIKELDVQPISDEDLQAYAQVAGGSSDIIVCTCSSSSITCYSNAV